MAAPASAPRFNPATRRAVNLLTWLLLGALVLLPLILAYAISVSDKGLATREVLFGVGHVLRWFLYAATAVVFVIIALGPLRRSELWRIGKTEGRTDRLFDRAKVFLIYGIGQGRMPNDLYASVMHLFIFWGWMVLFIGTLIIAIHADVVYFLEGCVYLAYSAMLDVFGIVAAIGLLMALNRRYLMRPRRCASAASGTTLCCSGSCWRS